MDRPEDIEPNPVNGKIYCALTNNSQRGKPGYPGIDAANPRADNAMGQILRWQEDGDFDGSTFVWNHLVLAGDPANNRAEAKGNVNGEGFACPDTIAFDGRGVLWIGTDMGAAVMNKGEFSRLGNNQLLACNPASGELRRFLVGPVNCEITAVTFTPDGRTMFVNVQHPGESVDTHSDPKDPRRWSNWPRWAKQSSSRRTFSRKWPIFARVLPFWKRVTWWLTATWRR